jgi:heme/copper-type cytochrome/quinol oxidase subunit 4
MDKYTKALLMVIKIPVGVFCSLLGLALIGVSFWVSTFSDIASMVLLIALLGGGALINFGIGYAFLGDEYKATNIVRDGNTTFAPNTTERFLKRRKIVMLIGFIAYLLLSVYYVVRAILVGAYYGYLQDIDFNTNIVAVIIFAVISLFLSIVFFLLYKKTKDVDLNEA